MQFNFNGVIVFGGGLVMDTAIVIMDYLGNKIMNLWSLEYL